MNRAHRNFMCLIGLCLFIFTSHIYAQVLVADTGGDQSKSQSKSKSQNKKDKKDQNKKNKKNKKKRTDSASPKKDPSNQSNEEKMDQVDQDTDKKEKGEPYVPKEIKELIRLPNPEHALLIPIEGTIDMGLPAFVRRSLDENPQAKVIILKVDTFGGRVDAAVQIRDRLLQEQRPCIAWVHRRAISAGALISLACDYIVFSDGSSMGAATPIQVQSGQAKAVGEKMVSYFRSEMRATAEANDWDGALAEAMVDADTEIEGVIAKGKLLTVTTKEAMKLRLANAHIDTLPQLLKEINVHANIKKTEANWAEKIARAVTDPTVSGLLMSVGMLGVMVELYSPGIGFAGILGFLSLLTFFFGHRVVGLAGLEELLILITGVILLAVEVFIIPGFGVAGILGLIFIATGMVTSMQELPDSVSWDLQVFDSALHTFLYSFLTSIILMIIIARYLPRSSLTSWLILDQDLSDAVVHQTQVSTSSASSQPLSLVMKENMSKENADQGAVNQASNLSHISHDIQVGQIGVTTTPLRLSGKGRFADEVLDIVSRDEYLEAHTSIKIVAIEATRVVVVRHIDAS